MSPLCSFASDNYSGVHPEVMAALNEANAGHARAYGEDAITEGFDAICGELFGPGTLAYPVFNGTGANIVSLAALTQRWGCVVASDTAHINTDECAGPEKMAGLKILALPSQQAKIRPEQLADFLAYPHLVHAPRPGVLSLTQATEWGTLYTVEELRELAHIAHSYGLAVHMDGARLANAVAATGASLKELTTDVGVDVLSLGGTKVGALCAEAIVVINPDAIGSINSPTPAPSPLEYIRKYSAQLASKMRYLSAQLIALYGGDLYLRNARHANAMASLLAQQAAKIPGVELVAETQVNSVFARIPRPVAEQVRRYYPFYDWDESGVVRWMCSFDTREEDVQGFVQQLAAACLTHHSQAKV